jgi:hypothetical protein
MRYHRDEHYTVRTRSKKSHTKNVLTISRLKKRVERNKYLNNTNDIKMTGKLLRKKTFSHGDGRG